MGDILYMLKHWESCSFEGVPALLSKDEARQLEELGALSNLEMLPGRGRYANRWRGVFEAEKTRALILHHEKQKTSDVQK